MAGERGARARAQPRRSRVETTTKSIFCGSSARPATGLGGAWLSRLRRPTSAAPSRAVRSPRSARTARPGCNASTAGCAAARALSNGRLRSDPVCRAATQFALGFFGGRVVCAAFTRRRPRPFAARSKVADPGEHAIVQPRIAGSEDADRVSSRRPSAPTKRPESRLPSVAFAIAGGAARGVLGQRRATPNVQ
jgi:hypothetical protein